MSQNFPEGRIRAKEIGESIEKKLTLFLFRFLKITGTGQNSAKNCYFFFTKTLRKDVGLIFKHPTTFPSLGLVDGFMPKLLVDFES